MASCTTPSITARDADENRDRQRHYLKICRSCCAFLGTWKAAKALERIRHILTGEPMRLAYD